MTRDEQILELVKLAEKKCRQMSRHYNFSREDFEDWVGDVTVLVIKYADKISACTNPEAYIRTMCKTHLPQRMKECQIPVNDEGEEMEFVEEKIDNSGNSLEKLESVKKFISSFRWEKPRTRFEFLRIQQWNRIRL